VGKRRLTGGLLMGLGVALALWAIDSPPVPGGPRGVRLRHPGAVLGEVTMPEWMKAWWFWALLWLGLLAARWGRILYEEISGRGGCDDL
jgi:hypothetical protein